MVISRQLNLFTRMKLLKLGVFLSMLLMTPVLEAQNTSVSLWEENIEQLSMDEEEKNKSLSDSEMPGTNLLISMLLLNVN